MAYGPQAPDDDAGGGLPSSCTAVLSGHDGAVLNCRFTGSGAYVLSCGKDRTIRLWSIGRGALLQTYVGHGHEVRDVAATPDNGRLASVGGDRQARRLAFCCPALPSPLLTAVLRRRSSCGTSPPGALSASSRATTGTPQPAPPLARARRVVKRANRRSQELSPPPVLSRSAVNAVLFAGGGDVVVTGGYDTTVRFWDCRSSSGDALASAPPARDAVTSLALAPCGAVVVSGSADGCVAAVDVRAGCVRADQLGAPVVSLALSRDGCCALASLAGGGAGCPGGALRLADLGSGALLAQYSERHANAGATRLGCALTADDAHVLAGGEGGEVVAYDLVGGGAPAGVLRAHPPRSPVCGLDGHPTQPGGMVTCATDGLVKVWQ